MRQVWLKNEKCKYNDNDLVYNTLKDIKWRTNFLIHPDCETQYSSYMMQDLANKKNHPISTGRVGHSLDNSEAKYFFGCLKGEFFKFYPTQKISYEKVAKLINKYIKWYNNSRIQSKLN